MHEFDHASGLFVPRKKLYNHPAKLQKPEWMVSGPGFFGGSTPYTKEVLADNPLFYYRLNETSGTVAQNLGSNGVAGTYSGTVALNAAPVFGTSPRSAAFTNGGMVNCNLPNGGTPSFALECVFNPSAGATGSMGTLIGKYSFFAVTQADFPVRLWWDIANSRVVYDLGKGGQWTTALALNSGALATGVDHHVVATYVDNASAELWVDGVLVASSAINFIISITAYNWAIGRAAFEQASPNGAGGSGFTGRLSEAAMYYKATPTPALSAARIQAHYAARMTAG